MIELKRLTDVSKLEIMELVNHPKFRHHVPCSGKPQ